MLGKNYCLTRSQAAHVRGRFPTFPGLVEVQAVGPLQMLSPWQRAHWETEASQPKQPAVSREHLPGTPCPVIRSRQKPRRKRGFHSLGQMSLFDWGCVWKASMRDLPVGFKNVEKDDGFDISRLESAFRRISKREEGFENGVCMPSSHSRPNGDVSGILDEDISSARGSKNEFPVRAEYVCKKSSGFRRKSNSCSSLDYRRPHFPALMGFLEHPPSPVCLCIYASFLLYV